MHLSVLLHLWHNLQVTSTATPTSRITALATHSLQAWGEVGQTSSMVSDNAAESPEAADVCFSLQTKSRNSAAVTLSRLPCCFALASGVESVVFGDLQLGHIVTECRSSKQVSDLSHLNK